MAKKRNRSAAKSPKRRWLVEMYLTHRTEVEVEADSREAAVAAAECGNWENEHVMETTDWSVASLRNVKELNIGALT